MWSLSGSPSAGAGAERDTERIAQAMAALADVQLELDHERVARYESESFFDVLIESMTDALVLVAPSGRIRRVNGQAARLLGTPAEQLVETPVGDVLGPDVPNTPWEILDTVEGDGSSGAFETELPCADGGSVPVSMACAVVREPEGKVLGTLYVARNLTETHRLVGRLEEAEARWRLVADVAELMTRELDPRDALVDVCGCIEQALECGAAVVLVEGRTIDDVVTASAAGESELRALVGTPVERRTGLAAALEQRTPVHAPQLAPGYPLLSTRPLGARSAALVPLEARGDAFGALLLHAAEPDRVPARSVELAGVVAGRIALALANARLRSSLAEAEAAQQAQRGREELLAGMSHDMQTPLSAILGAGRMLLDQPDLPAEQRTPLLEVLVGQAGQLRHLVRQFLDYSRLEAGHGLVVSARPTDVVALVRETVRWFAGEREVQVDAADDLPAALVDRDRLQQVIANLLSNADKFSPRGAPVHVAVSARAAAIDIVVADRGRGMTPATMAGLFEKFHRGAEADRTSGSGLGLYVARALVEAQGGRISATSRAGDGSRFTVSVPIATEDERP